MARPFVPKDQHRVMITVNRETAIAIHTYAKARSLSMEDAASELFHRHVPRETVGREQVEL